MKRCGISFLPLWNVILRLFFVFQRGSKSKAEASPERAVCGLGWRVSVRALRGERPQWPVPVEHQSVGRTKLIKGFSKNCSVPPQTLRELDVMSIFSANDIVIFFYPISEISKTCHHRHLRNLKTLPWSLRLLHSLP